MSEEVRRMSDELARDPSSRIFVPLGEALRQQGQFDMALKVTVRGLERHPHLADAHDLLARVCVDRGEMERAFDEWDMVLRLSPGHLGALKGMGFVCFHRARFAEAERYLAAALALDTLDDQVESIANDSRYLFLDVLPDEAQTALLLDPAGLVLAGAYIDGNGRDVAQDVGAELSGVTEAARRATRHLAMGDWTSIVFETEVAVVAMAPSSQDGLLVLATSRATPLGLVRRLLGRCQEKAQRWLGEQR
jgi:predicted regulator of Ras-like GTPase activity (Roadblock/LC7/MglB family)